MERWESVVGYEGRYEVSDLGRVRSLPRTITINYKRGSRERRIAGKMLQPVVMESGHLSATLSKDGSDERRMVHCLVLEAFVGPRPGHHTIWHGCHGDGDPANNALSNLRWDTRSGNEQDKVAHGRSNRGTRNRAAVLSEMQARVIKQRLEQGGESHAQIARDYGVTRETVTAIKLGRSWSWL